MPTNLALNDKLVKEAQKLGGHSTKRAAVNQALTEYVMRRKQKKIWSCLGNLTGIRHTITRKPGLAGENIS